MLVLPGFIAATARRSALRYLIRSWGYWAHGWGMGANLGPTTATPSGIHDRLEALHSRHGSRCELWSAGASAASTPGTSPARCRR